VRLFPEYGEPVPGFPVQREQRFEDVVLNRESAAGLRNIAAQIHPDMHSLAKRLGVAA